ncbi:(2Fe-2S)-binding protein [Acidicapsa dinghuensis]|uniref:(2Fe-2S)-binding protein n=1 Tax=Acidicapsa dinghuensis TaxID=2218256 RepID=A0ABW1EH60_9BACT|nr:(2Fe-2S)-binding protein [Acidicapsa dinghuensis]
MKEGTAISLNGRIVEVPKGATVAAALLQHGAGSRVSISGEARQPLCGMGICFECRASVNGRAHQLTCQLVCEPGMVVVTE